MPKLKTLLIVFSLVLLASTATALAESKFNTTSGSLSGVAVTTSQSAVFAAFLSDSNAAGIQTAISVSNPLAIPNGFQSDFVSLQGGDTQGTLEFYLWNEDGTSYFFETSMDPMVGRGLNSDGTLGPGQTYTVLLRDILGAAGFSGDPFIGYGWVVANFDAVVGTYSVTIFSVGFTQNYELLPGVGQGQVPGAGLPVRVVP